MPTTEHRKAAGLHEHAAKAHIAAAESHATGDTSKGVEHADAARAIATKASIQTDKAKTKSRNQK